MSRDILWRLAAGSGAGRARGLLRIWRWWERFASWQEGADPFPQAPHGVLRIRLVRYRGKPITLPDGTEVKRGEVVGELHIDNRVLVKKAVASKWEVLTLMRDDLQALAAWAAQDGIPPEVQVFYGVTLLTKGARWLGFTIRHRPVRLRARWDRLYFDGLLVIYSEEGQERLVRGKTPTEYPTEVWISRRELMRRYGARR